MLQSIAKEKYSDEIFKDFGMVIFDEAHHAPSKYFSKALPLITSKITIGLSATPNRTDKLEKILYWYFGDIMYKSQVKVNSNVLVNIINFNIVHEKFNEFKLKTGDINRAKTINKITTIGRRNKFIINILEDVLKNNSRKILILSDRIEHLKLLKDRIDKKNITTTGFYIGGMKQKDLKIAENMQVIFASYGMASEALDIPELNTLFMVTSRREVEQAVGRVIRKIVPNIRPTIYDFVDQLPSFIRQGYYRQKLYKKLGFEINNNSNLNEEIKSNDELNTNSSLDNIIDFID